jgi:pimeloyl-ACP methyl ester carboxylesterase
LTNPFDAMGEFKGEYRCIAADLRNANPGQSSGPLEIDRPWDSHTDDQLGVMDHLGINKFMVMGFCIGGPFIWNLLRRAPDRIVAAVLAQPSGSRPEMRDLFYETNMKDWGPELVKRRPDITMEMVERYLTKMYRTNADFVFTVTRDFVRRRHGGRDARAKGRSEHVPLEGAQGADSPGGAPDPFLPPGTSPCFCLDGGVCTTGRQQIRGAVPGWAVSGQFTAFPYLVHKRESSFLAAFWISSRAFCSSRGTPTPSAYKWPRAAIAVGHPASAASLIQCAATSLFLSTPVPRR